MRIARVCNHSFVSDILERNSIVFDCGSNRGEFYSWFKKRPEVIIHAFEPDPRFFKELPNQTNVIKHNLALSADGRDICLRLGNDKCSSEFYVEHSKQNCLKVQSTTLDSFCESSHICSIDLLKLDIEGAELELLQKTSDKLLRSIRQITVEFHDFLSPGDKPVIFDCIKRLKSLNFVVFKFSWNDHSDILFINRNLVNLPLSEFFLFYLTKYYRGARRAIKHLLTPFK